MRYWLSFGVVLGALLIISMTVFWALFQLPLALVLVVTTAGYGALVALNIVPPGRPSSGMGSLLADDPGDFDAEEPLDDGDDWDDITPPAYDPFETAHAYWNTRFDDDGRVSAAPIVIAGLGLLALSAFGLIALAAQFSFGGGGGGGEPTNPVGAVLGATPPGLPAIPETATAVPSPSPTASPTTAAPTPVPPTPIPPTAVPTTAVPPTPVPPTPVPPTAKPTKPKPKPTDTPTVTKPTSTPTTSAQGASPTSGTAAATAQQQSSEVHGRGRRRR